MRGSKTIKIFEIEWLVIVIEAAQVLASEDANIHDSKLLHKQQ